MTRKRLNNLQNLTTCKAKIVVFWAIKTQKLSINSIKTIQQIFMKVYHTIDMLIYRMF